MLLFSFFVCVQDNPGSSHSPQRHRSRSLPKPVETVWRQIRGAARTAGPATIFFHSQPGTTAETHICVPELRELLPPHSTTTTTQADCSRRRPKGIREVGEVKRARRAAGEEEATALEVTLLVLETSQRNIERGPPAHFTPHPQH